VIFTVRRGSEWSYTGIKPCDWLTGATACRHACGASILRSFLLIVAADGAWGSMAVMFIDFFKLTLGCMRL